MTQTGNIRAGVLASSARGPVAIWSKLISVIFTADMDPGTYEPCCSHVSGINSLTSLLDSGSKLAALIQAEAVPCSAKFHVVLGIICHGEGGG